MILRTLIYLDESGDLGWNFNHPYQKGGSSRKLTLSAVFVPQEKSKYLIRIVKALYQKRKRPLSHELKSVDLSMADKVLFLRLTEKMLAEHSDIKIYSITVNKLAVKNNFHQDPNVLYNYMVKRLLLAPICHTPYVDFLPDRRSERVNAKWNLAEYLNQMIKEVSLEQAIANVSCNVTPIDSSKSLELQFIDFFAGLVWAMYEFNDERMKNFMAENTVSDTKLFF